MDRSSPTSNLLCRTCEQIFLFVANLCCLMSEEGLPHHKWDDLIVNSKAGCKFCSLLRDKFHKPPARSNHLRLHALDGHRTLLLGKRSGTAFPRDLLKMRYLLVLWQSNPSSHCILDVQFLQEDHSPSATEDIPLIYHANDKIITENIMEWLHKCSVHHSCQIKSSQPLPTRVIDVGTIDSQPKLHLSKPNEQGQYLALSYCWGGHQTSSTTSETLLENTKGLRIERLPKTIQDAIQVTQKLGIPYLWVDALCIIQDSPHDKAIEIESMGTIYKNATATIAAVSAASVDMGFLRTVKKDHTCFTLAERSKRYSYVAIVDPAVVEWEGGPLESRAWAFQEAILSARIIFYEQRGYVWKHCCHKKLQPILEDNWKSPPILEWLGTAQLLAESESQPSGRFEAWKTIVEEFSGRCLTNREDRLPALAGIASQLLLSWKDEYLAGAWKSFLVNMLGWHRDPEHSSHFPDHERLAPTWSWASISGKIVLPGFGADAGVLDCHVEPLQPRAPLGRVKKGFVKLRAVVLDLPIAYYDLRGDGLMNFILDDPSSSLMFRRGIKLVHLGSQLEPKSGPARHLLIVWDCCRAWGFRLLETTGQLLSSSKCTGTKGCADAKCV
ncbi:HET-domain-containing protein [Stipitochalara longipes BDJ]|nr:HET-domain-containing protein [Stipitochalara longipes BDJ]